MALVTYPLNNINYSAEDAELYHCTRTSGVFASDEDFSASVSGADNIVNIGQGIAWIRNSRFSGKVVANKSAVSVDMGLADGTYGRIDAIVIRFDANDNQTEIVKKEGVASSAPVPPEVVQTEAVYELHLYHVYRRAGATSIVEGDITDLRVDRKYCGVMSDDVTMLGDDFINKDQIGVAGGVASLDGSGKVPTAQLPAMNYIPTSQKGVANGVATLGSNGKLPSSQLPSMNYIPTSQKGVANGVAPLNASKQIDQTYLPFKAKSYEYNYGGPVQTTNIVTVGDLVVCTGVGNLSELGIGALSVYISIQDLTEITKDGAYIPVVLYNTDKSKGMTSGYVITSSSGARIIVPTLNSGTFHYAFSFIKA